MSTVRTLSLVPSAAGAGAADPGAQALQDGDESGIVSVQTSSIMAPADAFSDARAMVARIAYNSGLKKWAVWGAMLKFCFQNEAEFTRNLAEYVAASNARSQSA